MDFIEKLFHISPDGGDGSLELIYLASFIVAALVIITNGKSLFDRLVKYLGQRTKRSGKDHLDD